MCQFFSAIVKREPRNKGGFELLWSPATDSHSELIQAHKLLDDGKLRFARVEFTPDKPENAADPKAYKLRIDEGRTPDWFDDEMQSAVVARLRTIIKGMIAEDGQYLLGGCWIVPKGVAVRVGPMTRVAVNLGTVTNNHGTVTDNYGTVTYNYGTVTTNYGTVTHNYGTVT